MVDIIITLFVICLIYIVIFKSDWIALFIENFKSVNWVNNIEKYRLQIVIIIVILYLWFCV